MTHELKTVQPYFEKVWFNEKIFEIRKNDRDFQVGDFALLREYDPENHTYSGRKFSMLFNGTHIVDFLRSRGYALPAYGYSVDDLVEDGIYKIKTEVK